MATISNTPRPGYVYDSTDAVWYPIGTGTHSHNEIASTIVDAKGDIIAATAADTVSRLAVGNNGETLVANSSTATGLAYQPHIEAGKNFAINGGMDIWQRGTSSSGNAYIADRWYSALVSGTGTFAQETTVIPTGNLYSQKFTASATAQPALYQAVETLNAVDLQGQTVVLSALVAASTSTGITLDVQHSSSTDVSVTGTWTSITATSGGTATPTSTTFVPITGVYAIPSTAKSLRIRIFTTSTIASSVVVYFANIQMEVGSIATAFSRAGGTIQGELAACQRYYFRLTQSANNEPLANYGNAVSTTTVEHIITFPVYMRISPTTVDFANLAAGDGVNARSNMSATTINFTSLQFGAVSSTSSSLTQFRNYNLFNQTSTTAYIGFSAEL